MIRLILICAAIVLSACAPAASMSSTDPGAARSVSDGERFRVERVEVFDDRLAYNDRRGVYIIRDKQTGREYIGVSGIGVTETGAHTQSCGKNCTTTVEDER